MTVLARHLITLEAVFCGWISGIPAMADVFHRHDYARALARQPPHPGSLEGHPQRDFGLDGVQP